MFCRRWVGQCHGCNECCKHPGMTSHISGRKALCLLQRNVQGLRRQVHHIYNKQTAEYCRANENQKSTNINLTHPKLWRSLTSLATWIPSNVRNTSTGTHNTQPNQGIDDRVVPPLATDTLALSQVVHGTKHSICKGHHPILPSHNFSGLGSFPCYPLQPISRQ